MALSLGVAAGTATAEVPARDRVTPVSLLGTHPPGFRLLPAASTGIQFRNDIPESRHLTNSILLNGSGVAAGDVDGDGRSDLFFCRAHGSNALYRNLGNWKFEDITAKAGVGSTNLTSTGTALVDLDGDGDLDLVVNTVGSGTRIYLNDGHGRFVQAFNLNAQVAGMSLAIADVDGDGYPDLYVANHRTSALMDFTGARFTFRTVNGRNEIATVNGRPVTDPDLADRFVQDAQGGIHELGVSDVLFRNEGGTNFSPSPFTGGAFLDQNGRPLAKAPRGWALTAAFHDVNGDGLPDLYVCHDFQSEDQFWLNQGHGVFRQIPAWAYRKMPMSSMAMDFGDINRDGAVDLLALDMMSRSHRERMLFLHEVPPVVHLPGLFLTRPQYEMNCLHLNRGDTTFAEIGQLSGLQAAEWAWSCIFLDVDLDGWEDVLVVNGMERAGRDADVADRIKKLRASRRLSDAEVYEARRMYPRQATANLAFRNCGDLTFEEVGQAWGFGWKGVSSSMALADLDNDGDLDVIVNNLNDTAGVFRNESTAPRIGVRLAGLPPNTRGIGAQIRVHGGAVPFQSQEMICGGRYLSSDDALRSFAAGSVTNRLKIEVLWRNGRRSLVENVEPNRIYEIVERADSPLVPAEAKSRTAPEPWFADVSEALKHTHHQETFDDFARQPLLPNRLSQLGPGLTWFDLDGDGHDDLIVGSGRGGKVTWLRGDGRGGFQTEALPALDRALEQDSTTILGWTANSNRPSLLLGLANYAAGPGTGTTVLQVDKQQPAPQPVLGATEASCGPLALSDLDGNGSLKLFVGGRVVGGRYPRATSSVILKQQQGKWVPDPENSAPLKDVGLVSGATFSDVNGDGYPDLLLACEWGPIRIFRNEHGKLTDATATLGMTNYVGWWNGIATGDFDGDGQMDIAASNWGRNTKYQAYRERPLLLYYGAFAASDTTDLLEAHWEPQLNKIVPERQFTALASALPALQARFTSHRAFSGAGIEEILGAQLPQARVLAANWLETTVFLNRGDHFEAKVLPVEAQMAPAFGIVAGDADGDGHEDIFLAQNFFDAQPETARSDAGRGLWLTGDGHGTFTAIDGSKSGVRVYGEQRGAALADFDEDGRIDLAVAQNGAETKLYHNLKARPGLRIRLNGPAGNPQGLGAAVALVSGQRRGPHHEVQAGGGYWSQNSTTLVLGAPEASTAVWVRWPGGKQATFPLSGPTLPPVVTVTY